MKSPRSRYAILGMLSIRPMSGYDIKKTVEGSINYFWTESYGQIYPMLKSLVAERLVTKTIKKQAGKPDRHVYALTTRGSKALHTWLAGQVMPTFERNELLLKLFFGEEGSIAVNIRHIRNTGNCRPNDTKESRPLNGISDLNSRRVLMHLTG